MADRLVTLRDGRRIGLTAFGDPVAERIVLFCHPAPGVRRLRPRSGGDLLLGRPRRVGRPPRLRVVDPARRRAPALASAAGPTTSPSTSSSSIEQARETGATPLHRVGVVGWSAGGRVALALAARTRASSTGSRSSRPRRPTPRCAGSRRSSRGRTRSCCSSRCRSRSSASARCSGRRCRTACPASSCSRRGRRTSRCSSGRGSRAACSACCSTRTTRAPSGVADDLLSYVGDDWGFDLDAVRAPTLLVYGAKDPFVPSAHGRWYRQAPPERGAAPDVVPRAGPPGDRARLGAHPAARRPAARPPLRRLSLERRSGLVRPSADPLESGSPHEPDASAAALPVHSSAVACPSGRRSMSRKHVMVQAIRGFKSHRHRVCKTPFDPRKHGDRRGSFFFP